MLASHENDKQGFFSKVCYFVVLDNSCCLFYFRVCVWITMLWFSLCYTFNLIKDPVKQVLLKNRWFLKLNRKSNNARKNAINFN